MGNYIGRYFGNPWIFSAVNFLADAISTGLALTLYQDRLYEKNETARRLMEENGLWEGGFQHDVKYVIPTVIEDSAVLYLLDRILGIEKHRISLHKTWLYFLGMRKGYSFVNNSLLIFVSHYDSLRKNPA